MKQVLKPLVVVLLLLTSCKINQTKKEMKPYSSAETQNAKTSATLSVVEKFNTAFNRHDIDGVMNAMTENCVFENTNPPPDGSRVVGAVAMRAFWEKFFVANPDAFFETEDIFATDHRCVVRWIYRKTKDGKPWHLRGIDVFKVRGGKIAEKLSYVKG